MTMNKKRIADYGIQIGCMKKGGLNKITDVPGVRVGQPFATSIIIPA